MRVDAVPLDKSIGKLSGLPIVNAIYEYETPNTFHTILLQISHGIYIKDMKHAMLCPNQYCDHGTIIEEIPPQLDHTVTVIFTITDGYYDLHIEQYGSTAEIHLIRPSEDKLEHHPIIDITDEDEWDPYKAFHNISVVNSTPIFNLDNYI